MSLISPFKKQNKQAKQKKQKKQKTPTPNRKPWEGLVFQLLFLGGEMQVEIHFFSFLNKSSIFFVENSNNI